MLADRHGDKQTDTTRSSQYFAPQFVSTSQVIGCEDRLRNDLYCVEWGVKLYSNQRSPAAAAGERRRDDDDDANSTSKQRHSHPGRKGIQFNDSIY